MDSISLGSHIFSSSPDWVRSGARTKNVNLFRGGGGQRYFIKKVPFGGCALCLWKLVSLLRKKKKCAVRRHTQNWVKRPAHAEKLECQKCSLDLAGSAFDPLPALYYKTATYLFLVFMLR